MASKVGKCFSNRSINSYSNKYAGSNLLPASDTPYLTTTTLMPYSSTESVKKNTKAQQETGSMKKDIRTYINGANSC